MLITNFEVKHDGETQYISLRNTDTSKFRFLRKATYVHEGDGWFSDLLGDAPYWEVETMNETEAVSRVNDLLVESGKKAIMFYVHGWTHPYKALCPVHKINKGSDYLVIPILWDSLNDLPFIGDTIDDWDYKIDRLYVAPVVAKNLGKLYTNFFSQIPNKNWLCHSMGCYVTQQFLQDVYNFYRSPNKSENVALDGNATMSCENENNHAENAIDGKIDGNFTQTCEADNIEAWWEVKLQKTYNISNVIIWNRKDCCQDYLHKTKVQIFDSSSMKVVNEEVIQFTPGIQPSKVIVNFDKKYEDDGKLKIEGDVIRILKSSDDGDSINFNEVEVYVVDDSFSDENSEKIDNLIMVAPDVRYDLFNEWPLDSGEDKNECSPSEWFDEITLRRNPDCRLGGGRAITNMVNDKVHVYWNSLDDLTQTREFALKVGIWHISVKPLMAYGNGDEGREVRSEFKDKVLFTEMSTILTPKEEHSYQFFDELIEFYDLILTNHTNHTTSPGLPVYYTDVEIYDASVCDLDSWGFGDTDTYVVVKISLNGEPYQDCGTTEMKSNTNNPTWNEVISCSNIHFTASDATKILFEAHDDDHYYDDIIGYASTLIDTNGTLDETLQLEDGECQNEESNIRFKIHLNQI